MSVVRNTRDAISKSLSVAVLALAGVISVGAHTLSSASKANVPPSLSISPISGPVGTVVHVKYAAGSLHLAFTDGSDCGQVVFMRVGGNIHSGTAWTSPEQIDGSGDVLSNGSIDMRVMIPVFLGASTTPVVPGRYEFAYSCGGSTQLAIPPKTTAVTFTVTAPDPDRFVGIASTSDGRGYWLAQAGGGVFSYGDARFHGSLPGIRVSPASPIVGITATPDGGGYWLVGADGGIFAFGDAPFVGSIPQHELFLKGPIIGMAPTSDGKGYWLLGADGGVLGDPAEFAFGDAPFCEPRLPGPQVPYVLPPGTVTGLAPQVAVSRNTASTDDVGFVEATALETGQEVPYPLSSCAASPADSYDLGPLDPSLSAQTSGITSSQGVIWFTAIDGGVFSALVAPTFVETGEPFYGSLPGLGITPNAAIVAIAATPSAKGYWLLGADGGVFAFGDAPFLGAGTPR